MTNPSSAPLPDQGDLSSVNDLLFRSGAAFDGFTSQMRRALGLNAHERLAISIMWARGPQTMTELGAAIPLSRAAVTTLVDRLERADLVRRGSDVSDRRRTVVHVTDAALDRMRPVLREWMAAVQQLVASRSDAEWQMIAQFMRDFTELNQRQADHLATLDDVEIQALARDDAATEEPP